ncbi:Homeobox protein ceh-18 [Toxocara canis]|uniref:POU domain protein n=1 Tax=Toxocara canis TaxID=6265 RepID=A0A0B2VM16_TOXCA|nr:Homeobox protein ceh-18 [Toxocara canis]
MQTVTLCSVSLIGFLVLIIDAPYFSASNNRSSKGYGHSIDARVNADNTVKCEHDETCSSATKESSNFVGTLPSTSDSQSTCFVSDSSCWQSGYISASRSAPSSAGKRKAALPRKRPAALEEVVEISADTGEVVGEESMGTSADFMGTNSDTALPKTDWRRSAAVRNIVPAASLCKPPNLPSVDPLQSNVNAGKAGLDCTLFGSFSTIASCPHAQGSSNDSVCKDVYMGTDEKLFSQITSTGDDYGILPISLKSDPDGPPPLMQRRIERGNAKHKTDEERKESVGILDAGIGHAVKQEPNGCMEPATGEFLSIASCPHAQGSSNDSVCKDVYMGTDEKLFSQITSTGDDYGILPISLKSDPDGPPPLMQRRIERGNAKHKTDEERKESVGILDAGIGHAVKQEPNGCMEPATGEFLRNDASVGSNRCAVPSGASATTALNGLCGNSVGAIQDLLLTAPSPAAINAAVSGLLATAGGVTDMSNTLGALSASDLLTATGATGVLPFIGANLAEVGADPQKMQMALIEAAAAAASTTFCGLMGSANVVAGEREKSGFGLLEQAQYPSVIASKSTQQTVNGALNTTEGQDPLTKDGRLTFAQKLLAGDEEWRCSEVACCDHLEPPLGGCEAGKYAKSEELESLTVRGEAPRMTREDRIDLEELEIFAQTFKKQRIKFGFTQGDVGMALGRRYGTDFSQTTISRFEALNLSFKNMCKLRPLLKEWLADAEAAIANGATASDLLEAQKSESSTTQVGTSVGLSVPSTVISSVEESPSPNGSCVGTSGIPLRKRRKRTNLDSTQRAALDGYFQINPRPDHDRMAQIAATLELDRDVVRVWFCNRRQKLRKE